MGRGPLFGHVSGYPPGATFENRTELSRSRVHRPTQHGICGTGAGGAESVVVSGGYVDDHDSGDVILYTGAGGRDPLTGRQVHPQLLRAQNLSLVTSMRLGLPVRVIRGAHPDVYDPPPAGFRYDGLYRVTTFWDETGHDGFRVWRFRLEALAEEPIGLGRAAEPADLFSASRQPERRGVVVSRTVRDTAMTREVKRLYDYRCQVCDERVETPTGPYAEAAHVRPLGRPHGGPDVRANVLCLCPNHHAAFDLYAFAVADDFTLIGLPGVLTVRPEHPIDPAHLGYHRGHYEAAQEGRS